MLVIIAARNGLKEVCEMIINRWANQVISEVGDCYGSIIMTSMEDVKNLTYTAIDSRKRYEEQPKQVVSENNNYRNFYISNINDDTDALGDNSLFE